MTIDEILDQIDMYVEWVRDRPFGAPTDTGAYAEHLTMQRAIAEMMERERLGQVQIEGA